MKHVLKSPRLVLTVITANDRDAVYMTMNYQKTAETISFMSWPMTMEQADDWCAESARGAKNKTDTLFIARNPVGLPIGCIGLHDMNKDGKNSAETGYWVNEEFQGQGFASEMLAAVIKYGFETLGLDSIYATALPDNLKSQAILEKNGFKMTGKTTIQVQPGKNPDRIIFELKKS